MAEFPAASPEHPPASAGPATSPSFTLPAFSSEKPARSLSPLKWFAVGVAVLCIGAAGTAYGAWSSWAKGGLIAPGIVVQGENIGGLAPDDARTKLQTRFGQLFVTVRTAGRDFDVSLSELGGSPNLDYAIDSARKFGRSGHLLADVTGVWRARSTEEHLSLPVQWNKSRLRQKMWAIATQVNVPPRDAGLKVENGVVTVVSHQPGLAMNVGATCAELQKRYYLGLPAIEATIRETQPHLLASDLEGRDVKLGFYSTRYNSGEVGRTRNIYVAAGEVDGTVLLPGEEFSFNRTTGERTWKKGYRMAHIFERKPGETESEVVDGLAGGVCQVSSTLFNAVRRANEKSEGGLKIVERTSHSLPVTYVPSGLDATVAWPGKDFRFRNDFPHPIYLRTHVGDRRLVIEVWGRVQES